MNAVAGMIERRFVPPADCQIDGLEGVYESYFGDLEKGTFVEVGAYDGQFVSNTCFLADCGWKGYYIEPVAEYAAQCKRRHANNNVVVSEQAIGDYNGTLRLSVAKTLSSACPQTIDFFEKGLVEGFAGLHHGEFRTVKVQTLNDYLHTHGVQPRFELLVIDVEGFEWEVLKSWNIKDWMPLMIIVEMAEQSAAWQAEPWVRERNANINGFMQNSGYTAIHRDHTNTIFVREVRSQPRPTLPDPVIAEKPETADDVLSRIEAVAAEGHFCDAQRMAEKVLTLFPRNSKAYNILGYVKYRENKSDEAASLFQKALEMDPSNLDARANLAEISSSAHCAPVSSNHQKRTTPDLSRFKEQFGCLRLHLGCGEQHLDGYVNIDFPQENHTTMKTVAEVFADIRDLHFAANTIDEVRLHHVFEHFTRTTAMALLIRWHQWLAISGRLVIEVPDADEMAKVYTQTRDYDLKMKMTRGMVAEHDITPWAYHLDLWFEERFRRTLSPLGYSIENVKRLRWPTYPFLPSIIIIAKKQKTLTLQEYLRASAEIFKPVVLEARVLDMYMEKLRQMVTG